MSDDGIWIGAEILRHPHSGKNLRRTSIATLWEVAEERARQDVKWGEQNHPDGTGDPLWTALADVVRMVCDQTHQNSTGTWMTILLEELCEALAESDPAKLRAELIQLCAVGVAWVEAIDRRGGPVPMPTVAQMRKLIGQRVTVFLAWGSGPGKQIAGVLVEVEDDGGVVVGTATGRRYGWPCMGIVATNGPDS